MKTIFWNASPLRKTLLFATGMAVGFQACRTAEIPVTDELKSGTEVYSVKGRQGLQIGQTLTFGVYQTSKISRGWTHRYSIPFVAHFSGAREKLSFQQFGPAGRSAQVALVGRFRETEFSPLGQYFSISVKNKNTFAGGIELNGSGEGWEFVVSNPDGWGNSLRNTTLGFVRSREDHFQIDIVSIRQLEGISQLMTMQEVYGYEFRLNGKTIGAVSTLNQGKVWIKENIHPEVKLVLASVSSGLLLRTNLVESREEVALGR